MRYLCDSHLRIKSAILPGPTANSLILTVVGVHARAKRVEDSSDADLYILLARVRVAHSFRYSLALVVARSRAECVDVPKVRLRLRVNVGVPIHLRGRRKHEPRSSTLRQAQHVHRSDSGYLDSLDGVVLIVRRGCGAREVVDLIHLDVEGLDDVVLKKHEVRVPVPMCDVLKAAREEVVCGGVGDVGRRHKSNLLQITYLTHKLDAPVP